MRRLAGYDLTGWRDFAARNWKERPGHELIETARQVVSGGAGGVVIRLGNARQQHDLVGGIQAIRAPHGLGEGWGSIGSVERRERVANLLRDPIRYAPEIAAALRAMANPDKAGSVMGTTAVLAIPDTAAFEIEQEGLLDALRKLGVNGDSLLVWRSVLACLAAVERGLCNGIRWIGVVGHDAEGLTNQLFRMREVRGQWAPERQETGQAHHWEAGLDTLLRRAQETIVTVSGSSRCSPHLTSAKCVVPLALGESPSADIVRRPDGTWQTIRPPQPESTPVPPIPLELVAHLSKCEIVLLETPTSGSVRQSLTDALSSVFQVSVVPLDHWDIALGGLIAARKVVHGEPIYFDFLPQISTIIQDATKARNYDLIQSDEPLPAGQVYRSAEPAKLSILAGMDQIKVYLRKQAVDECRLAVVPLSAKADAAATVDLYVEQTPAAGRARLTLASEVFPTPLSINWDTARIQKGSWEALIESLQPKHPSIPNRQILKCDLGLWRDVYRSSDLTSVLMLAIKVGKFRWYRLATLMSARSDGFYAVSSDGDLPAGLEPEVVAAFETVTKAAAAHVQQRLDHRIVDDNQSLRFLTWQFRRCPPGIIRALLDVLDSPTRQHVFLANAASRQLVYHALGRTVTSSEQLRIVFDHLLACHVTKWKSYQFACAAQLLARTDAPSLLDQGEIKMLGEVVIHANRNAIGGNYQARFFYAPYILVGLLRRRQKDRFALVAGKDSLADRLLETTQEVIADMRRRFSHDNRVERYRKVLEDCCRELNGKGWNPDILVDLAGITGG